MKQVQKTKLPSTGDLEMLTAGKPRVLRKQSEV